MKRVLLLLFLFPVVLSAQTQRRQVIDPGKEDSLINISNFSLLPGNNPHTREADIRFVHKVTDSGEYVITTVFFPILTALDSAGYDSLAVLTVAATNKIPTDDIPVARLELITSLPSLPLVKDESLTSMERLGVVAISTAEIPAIEMKISASILPLADFIPFEFPAVNLLAINPIMTNILTESEAELFTNVPRLPIFKDDSIPDMQLVGINEIKTTILADARLEAVAITIPLPFYIADDIDLSPMLHVAPIYTATIPAGKADSVTPFVMLEDELYPVDEMHLSEEGYSLLEKLEGYSPELYSLNDGGYTIGFGFFVPYSEGTKWRKGVSWEEAERLIHQKVPAYENQVKAFINIKLSQKEFDALTMLAYNLGGFSKATSIVNDINNLEGYDQLQADWKRFIHSKAPNVSKGLMNRRKDELGVRSISDYQPDRKVIIYKNRN